MGSGEWGVGEWGNEEWGVGEWGNEEWGVISSPVISLGLPDRRLTPPVMNGTNTPIPPLPPTPHSPLPTPHFHVSVNFMGKSQKIAIIP
ncbi:MAG: hypothetical protein DSM106950_23885 [Stigonema ocellatum SAG 48.90 = DSM 106950]|nr:hypothetical protein [Stigonema ocellatum SAG 48.90 = DSM 106950]